MTLKTVADVRELLKHVPPDRSRLSTWQYVEKCLNEAAASGDAAGLSVALQIVFQLERVPYTMASE